MTHSIKILHLEDVQSDAELVERTLKRSGIAFEKLLVDTRAEFTKALDEFEPDIILSDHSLPSFNSLQALKLLKESGRKIPFILITATVSEEFAVNVMQEGASDYVLKDRLQRLPSAILNALGKFQSDAERQQYLNKIVASEALFTKAESIAEFGTWRMDVINNVTTWSAGTYRLLGYQEYEAEPVYESFLRNIYPDDKERVAEAFENALKTAKSGEDNFRIINQDGSIRYVHSQYEFEYDDEGQPVSIIGFNQDVTHQTLAQDEIQKNIEELQAASDRQTAILNAMPPNTVLLNETGKIIAVNEAWRKFTLANNLGVPRHGVGFSYTAIAGTATGVDDVSAKKIAKGIRDIISGTSDQFSTEYSYIFQNKKVWYRVIIAPLADKTTKGAVILHIDITDWKLAEELRFQSEANLRTIFDNTEMAYVLCNDEHKIVSFNSKADELAIEQLGKGLKTGVNAFHYFPKSKVHNVKEAMHEVIEHGKISYETTYELKDGTTKWYEVTWVGVANDNQENIGFILAFKDITERKLADIERDRITADLVQRNNDLEQFTYIVSHNLRAPVANIKGLSNMLNVPNFDLNENQEIASSLATSINVLDGMIMDLNHILQVKSNVNENKDDIMFQSLVDDIKMSLRNLIETEQGVIHCNFNAARHIVSIKSYMYSIFYNLILNAIKYRQQNAAPVLHIFTRKVDDKLQIVFKDNGKGIEERHLKSLFGLYKRFDTSVEGKGMGLFMVKMQVETLGGKIDVESERGTGTTFIVEFADTTTLHNR